MPGDYAALEASRSARDPRDLTAAASPARASAPFAYKGAVVHRHAGRAAVVSADGLRFEYAGTPSAARIAPTVSVGGHALNDADTGRNPTGSGYLPRQQGAGGRFDSGASVRNRSGGGPGRGAAGWSVEKRRAVSRKANAARWAK